MSELIIQLDDAVERQASRVLADLNISKGEAVRMLFEYIATHKQVPTVQPARAPQSTHLTDLLMQMPNVGEETDFARAQDRQAPEIFD